MLDVLDDVYATRKSVNLKDIFHIKLQTIL